MARARKASVTTSNIMALVYGEQFTGKSTIAMQATLFKRADGKPCRVLFLDAEAGSIDDYLPELETLGVNLENLYIVYTQSLAEVTQYIDKIRNNEDFYELDEDGEETAELYSTGIYAAPLSLLLLAFNNYNIVSDQMLFITSLCIS